MLAALLAAALGAGEARSEPAFVAMWSNSDGDFAERVESTRSAALELGLRNVEGAARALLVEPPPEGAVAGARAAVRLAPDLPAAHMALAGALLREEYALGGAFRAALDAVAAFDRHLEASLWLHASVPHAAGLALAGAAGLFLLLMALGVAREAAHDLGDRLSEETPAFARAALLALVVLLPLALGEGPFGLALGLLVVVAAYGSTGTRVAAAVAAALGVLGLHPILDQAGRGAGALGADPVARAAHVAEHGLASPMELARLQAAADDNPLAGRALALGMKRRGQLREADLRYGELLDADPENTVLLNNAANVRLGLGDVEGAIELYQEALDRDPDSAVGWFNLSQAWGVALRVVELDEALAEAQELDPELVVDLSEIQGRATHFVADLPIPTEVVRSRLLEAADGPTIGAILRRPFAPGLLSRTPVGAAAACAVALGLGMLAGSVARRSRRCDRCDARVCPRCDPQGSSPSLCDGCSRLFQRSESTDPALRAARFAALRKKQDRREKIQQALSLLVPGLAGAVAGRSGLALVGCLGFATAVVFWLLRAGNVPDPLAAGSAGTGVLAGVAVVGLGVHVACIVLGIAAQRGT